MKGSGVILGWRVGGIGWGVAECLPIRHLPFYGEFAASCGQSRTPARSGLEEGEREAVRNGEPEMDDGSPSPSQSSSRKWKECRCDAPVSLYFKREM